MAAAVRPGGPYKCAIAGAGVSDHKRIWAQFYTNPFFRERQAPTVDAAPAPVAVDAALAVAAGGDAGVAPVVARGKTLIRLDLKSPEGRAALHHLVRDADVLVLIRERTQITRQLIEKLPKLKMISQTGKIGSHVDVVACTERGIVVAEGAGSPVAPAEMQAPTLALLNDQSRTFQSTIFSGLPKA